MSSFLRSSWRLVCLACIGLLYLSTTPLTCTAVSATSAHPTTSQAKTEQVQHAQMKADTAAPSTSTSTSTSSSTSPSTSSSPSFTSSTSTSSSADPSSTSTDSSSTDSSSIPLKDPPGFAETMSRRKEEEELHTKRRIHTLHERHTRRQEHIQQLLKEVESGRLSAAALSTDSAAATAAASSSPAPSLLEQKMSSTVLNSVTHELSLKRTFAHDPEQYVMFRELRNKAMTLFFNEEWDEARELFLKASNLYFAALREPYKHIASVKSLGETIEHKMSENGGDPFDVSSIPLRSNDKDASKYNKLAHAMDGEVGSNSQLRGEMKSLKEEFRKKEENAKPIVQNALNAFMKTLNTPSIAKK